MKSRIQYLRDASDNPIGCVALVIDRHNKQILHQVSTCNPVDHFDSKEARLLALTRLVESPMRIPLPRSSEKGVTEAIMKSLSISKKIPSRAAKAAKRWLRLPRNAE